MAQPSHHLTPTGQNPSLTHSSSISDLRTSPIDNGAASRKRLRLPSISPPPLANRKRYRPGWQDFGSSGRDGRNESERQPYSSASSYSRADTFRPGDGASSLRIASRRISPMNLASSGQTPDVSESIGRSVENILKVPDKCQRSGRSILNAVTQGDNHNEMNAASERSLKFTKESAGSSGQTSFQQGSSNAIQVLPGDLELRPHIFISKKHVPLSDKTVFHMTKMCGLGEGVSIKMDNNGYYIVFPDSKDGMKEMLTMQRNNNKRLLYNQYVLKMEIRANNIPSTYSAPPIRATDLSTHLGTTTTSKPPKAMTQIQKSHYDHSNDVRSHTGSVAEPSLNSGAAPLILGGEYARTADISEGTKLSKAHKDVAQSQEALVDRSERGQQEVSVQNRSSQLKIRHRLRPSSFTDLISRAWDNSMRTANNTGLRSPPPALSPRQGCQLAESFKAAASDAQPFSRPSSQPRIGRGDKASSSAPSEALTGSSGSKPTKCAECGSDYFPEFKKSVSCPTCTRVFHKTCARGYSSSWQCPKCAKDDRKYRNTSNMKESKSKARVQRGLRAESGVQLGHPQEDLRITLTSQNVDILSMGSPSPSVDSENLIAQAMPVSNQFAGTAHSDKELSSTQTKESQETATRLSINNACSLPNGTGPASIERDTVTATDAFLSDALIRPSLSPDRIHSRKQASRDHSITSDKSSILPTQRGAAETCQTYTSDTGEGDTSTTDSTSDDVVPTVTICRETSSSLSSRASTHASDRESMDSVTGNATRAEPSPKSSESLSNQDLDDGRDLSGDDSGAEAADADAGADAVADAVAEASDAIIRDADALTLKSAQIRGIHGSQYPDTLKNMIARALLDAAEQSLTVGEILTYCKDTLGYAGKDEKLRKSLSPILAQCDHFTKAFRTGNVFSFKFTEGAAEYFKQNLKPLDPLAGQSARPRAPRKPQRKPRTKRYIHKAKPALPDASSRSTHTRPANLASAPPGGARLRNKAKPTEDPVYEHMFVRRHRVYYGENGMEIVPGYKDQTGKKWDQLTRVQSMIIGQTVYLIGDFVKLPLPSKYFFPEFPAVPRIDTIARIQLIAKRDDVQGEAVLVNWYLTREAAEKWDCRNLHQWDDTDENEYVRSDIHDVVSSDAFIEQIHLIRDARQINFSQKVELTVFGKNRRISLKTQEPAEVYSLFFSLYQYNLTQDEGLLWYRCQDDETRSAARRALFSRVESGITAAREAEKDVETSFSAYLIDFFQTLLRIEADKVKDGDETNVEDAGQYTGGVILLLKDSPSDRARRRLSRQIEVAESYQNSIGFRAINRPDNKRSQRTAANPAAINHGDDGHPVVGSALNGHRKIRKDGRKIHKDRGGQVRENKSPVVVPTDDHDHHSYFTADSREADSMSKSELMIHHALLQDLRNRDFSVVDPFTVAPEYDPTYLSTLSKTREIIRKRPKAKAVSKQRLAHARRFRDPDNIHKEVDRPLPTTYNMPHGGLDIKSSSMASGDKRRRVEMMNDPGLSADDSSSSSEELENESFDTIQELLGLPENAKPTKYNQGLAFRDLVMVNGRVRRQNPFYEVGGIS